MVTKELLKKLKPMLAVSAEPFDSEEYIFEVKWDGFRCLSYLGDTTVLQSRNNLDFSHKFPELSGLHRQVEGYPVIVDGEIVIMDNGVPSFYELQKRGWSGEKSVIQRASREKPATYVVFDILYAGKEKLLNLPLLERKEILKSIITPDDRLYISEGIPEDGTDFFRVCLERDLEGIIAKKADSTYVPGKRTPYWKKIKKSLEGEFIICGYKQTASGSDRVDVLILGCPTDNGLVFQGSVGVGLGGVTGRRIYPLLKPLEIKTPISKVPRDINKGVTWVEPVICCAVEFLEPARDGGLRHPVFRGLRQDLGPEDCTGIAGAMAGRRYFFEQ